MTKTVNDIQSINFASGVFTPLDYGMDESEARVASGAVSRKFNVALWQGKVGAVDFPATETTEVCWLTEGRVALTDEAGGRREFSAGEGYLLPKGFAGRWETLADAKKIAVILED
ncbi:cupin domain-containing protein [Pelomonas sp. KK5]|uniref:cupin domain-containing protein n=1 Tax=Pelomonas sp. KK5 TaxID=1855730 RepID=UPI00097BD433|nr:cupin domain-containing protein [Pelomonas sp. KK5]